MLLLNDREREPLRSTFRNEFDSDLPEESQANIIATDELEAFVTAETLLRVGMLWVKPALRNTPRSSRLIIQLVKYLFRNIPKGSSVVTIATDPDQERLFERIGMRPIEGTIYRLDI